MLDDLKKSTELKARISMGLYKRSKHETLYPEDVSRSTTASSVLFLVGRGCGDRGRETEPCVILNKRSLKVKQPGDLCFPGGRVSPLADSLVSKVLAWPFMPLKRWTYWKPWQAKGKAESQRLGLLLATSLRESVEEMRLNPLVVTFLGPMPSQDLRMFSRVLYPMVAWVNGQRRFFPNWEVERIVRVPLRKLFESEAYALYRIRFQGRHQEMFTEDFPCFRYETNKEKEILWGVTYRIVMEFLRLIFHFTPPPPDLLPVIQGSMDETYSNGAG